MKQRDITKEVNERVRNNERVYIYGTEIRDGRIVGKLFNSQKELDDYVLTLRNQ